MDRARLNLEMQEMRCIPRLRTFQLFEDTDCGRDDWRRYFWVGHAPTGHELIARYPNSYPYKHLNVRVSPDIETHHKWEGGLCLMRGGEWKPDYTAATNILIAFRFLEDYQLGEVE